MLQKLKNFWQNPYAAPLTQPLRNIGAIVAGLVEPYTEAFAYARTPDTYRDSTPVGRFVAHLFDVSNSFVTVASSFVAFAAGIVVGGVGGGVAGYSGLAGAGAAAQWGGAAVAGLAGGAVGFVAAPVVLVTAAAFVGVVVGAVVGGLPGVITGTKTALKHHHDLKNPPPAVAAATPAAAAAPVATSKDRIEAIRNEFKQLPKSEQNLVLGLLEDTADPAASLQTRVLRNVDKMNDAQRTALAEVLEEKLAGAFDAVAARKAAEAGVLDEDVTVKPIATKLRRRNASPAASA